MKIIAFANRKGGVGKTSLCLHTAGVLAESGRRTLIVDMDEQGDISQLFVEALYDVRPTVADLLRFEPEVSPEEVIRPTPIEGIDILPANWDLGDIDERLAGDYDSEYYLLDALKQVRDRYDYLLIDTPPYSGRASRLALVASDGVVVPLECDRWSFAGAQRMVAYVDRIQRRPNPNLRLLGFLINKYSAQRTVEREYERAIRAAHGELVFKTVFGSLVAFKEAATAGTPITHYEAGGDKADIARHFVEELLARG